MKALDDSTIQIIRHLYQHGASTYELADQYYVCRETIWQYVKDIKNRNKNLHKRKLSNNRIEQVKAARRLGVRCTELADMLQVSRMTISRWGGANGIIP